jgi:hypothetical protein
VSRLFFSAACVVPAVCVVAHYRAGVRQYDDKDVVVLLGLVRRGGLLRSGQDRLFPKKNRQKN